MRKLISYILLLSLTLLSSCVSIQKAEHTPTHEAEFNKPLKQLKAEYTDIELYESVWRGFPPQTLDYKDLVNKWGEPQKEEKLWGRYFTSLALNGALAIGLLNMPVSLLIAIQAIITPLPAESNIWKKGDTQIEAFTHQNMLNGFDKRFGTWEWTKQRN